MAKLKLPETEILDDEPFANDKLDRREPIETLTNLIDNIDSPFILSVDAPWGSVVGAAPTGVVRNLVPARYARRYCMPRTVSANLSVTPDA